MGEVIYASFHKRIPIKPLFAEGEVTMDVRESLDDILRNHDKPNAPWRNFATNRLETWAKLRQEQLDTFCIDNGLSPSDCLIITQDRDEWVTDKRKSIEPVHLIKVDM
jgi:hypothetical protein